MFIPKLSTVSTIRFATGEAVACARIAPTIRIKSTVFISSDFCFPTKIVPDISVHQIDSFFLLAQRRSVDKVKQYLPTLQRLAAHADYSGADLVAPMIRVSGGETMDCACDAQQRSVSVRGIDVVHINNLPLCLRIANTSEFCSSLYLTRWEAPIKLRALSPIRQPGSTARSSKAHWRRIDVSALFHVRDSVRREHRFMAAVRREPQGSPAL